MVVCHTPRAQTTHKQHTHTHTHTHTHSENTMMIVCHTPRAQNTHTHTVTCTHTLTQSLTHSHTHIHTHTHTHTRTFQEHLESEVSKARQVLILKQHEKETLTSERDSLRSTIQTLRIERDHLAKVLKH